MQQDARWSVQTLSQPRKTYGECNGETSDLEGDARARGLLECTIRSLLSIFYRCGCFFFLCAFLSVDLCEQSVHQFYWLFDVLGVISFPFSIVEGDNFTSNDEPLCFSYGGASETVA
jgi:hypothetical protein